MGSHNGFNHDVNVIMQQWCLVTVFENSPMQLKVNRWRGSLSGGKDHLKLFLRGVSPNNLCA